MIVIDVNLLIYAVNQDSACHQKAKSWLETAVSRTETVALDHSPGISPIDDETGTVSKTAQRRHGIRHSRCLAAAAFSNRARAYRTTPATMRDLISPLGTGRNLTSDAHLAALAIENGAELAQRTTTSEGLIGSAGAIRWLDERITAGTLLWPQGRKSNSRHLRFTAAALNTATST